MASTSGPSFQHAGPCSSTIDHHGHTPHCTTLSKRDIKPGCSAPQVIDLTSESPTPPVMSQQPLRHLPSPHLHPYAHPQHPYSQHSSAFHRVNNGGHSIEAHGPIPNRGCPYLYYTQPTRPHTHQQHQPHPHTSHTRQHTHQPHPHTSHTRPLHHLPSSAFSPIAMNGTVALQHPPSVEGSAVLIDVDQMPDHVRSLPVTSLPNPLIVTSVPMATPTYVQPPAPQPMLRRVDIESDSQSQHQHHHYHHHHHHHHHYTQQQPPYPTVPPTPSHHSASHLPYPSPPPLHHRHYRRWQQNRGSHQGWSTTHPVPPTVHPSFHPDIWYHLLSIMRPHMAAPMAAPQPPAAWDTEQYQQENYETLLNLAEQIGEAKPKGLSRAEIDQLPTYRTTVESKKSNGDSRCVVCLMEFEEKQLVRVLPCMHEYHTRCIDKWLKSNRSCPICRSEVNISD